MTILTKIGLGLFPAIIITFYLGGDPNREIKSTFKPYRREAIEAVNKAVKLYDEKQVVENKLNPEQTSKILCTADNFESEDKREYCQILIKTYHDAILKAKEEKKEVFSVIDTDEVIAQKKEFVLAPSHEHH